MDETLSAVQRWLDTATGGIRFGPDRWAVREELEGHLEDKKLDFQRIFPGMTEAEAAERALSEMGDAQEIGKELAKIHKPWLGYLWLFSKVLMAVLVVLILVSRCNQVPFSYMAGFLEALRLSWPWS